VGGLVEAGELLLLGDPDPMVLSTTCPRMYETTKE
jgi:hypothetical protein